jgi:hypothetical protein
MNQKSPVNALQNGAYDRSFRGAVQALLTAAGQMKKLRHLAPFSLRFTETLPTELQQSASTCLRQ